MDLLSGVHIFQDLPRGDVEVLMEGRPMWTAGTGTLFYGANDGPDVLFLLKSGRVELYRQSPDGKKLTLGIVEQGDIFGEMSLVGRPLLGTYAAAIDDAVVCTLSREDVHGLIFEHPGVGLRIVETLAIRLQQARDAFDEMAFSDVLGRVASLLLRLSDTGTNVVDGHSNQDLAAMIGCLQESFTVTLDQLGRSGAVTIGRKQVVITDRAKLERVVSQRSGRLSATASLLSP